MYSSLSSAQVTKAVDSLKSDLPTVDIQHYAGAGSGLARFVARVVHTAASRKNSALVSEAIRNKFNGQLQAVAGSLRIEDKGPVSDTISGVVSVVRESVAIASSEDMTGFRAVASNMYLDDEERMWTLNTTAAGNLMVRTTGIDDDHALIGHLSAVASSARTAQEGERLQAVASAIQSKIEGGKFVSYVNHNNEIAHGFIVVTASDEPVAVVLPMGQGDAEQVALTAVTEVHEVSSDVLPVLTEDEQVQISIASARGAVNMEMMLDYYRRVFARSDEYFNAFADRLRSHSFC